MYSWLGVNLSPKSLAGQVIVAAAAAAAAAVLYQLPGEVEIASVLLISIHGGRISTFQNDIQHKANCLS